MKPNQQVGDSAGPPTDAEYRSVMRAWGRMLSAVGAEAGPFFREMEITGAQMRALGQLRTQGRMIGRELAASLGVTPGAVVPLVDRLEERGYLRRVPDEVDRRVTWLELTAGGEQFFYGLWARAGQKVAGAIAQLSPDDRATLERLLNHIADHLEQDREGDQEAQVHP
ncbi:MAG: MarR family transcriptional regulator [Chloroflexi bacterium]|nr:MarR family transcriptional regulator [Chloroflexota bacterium]